MTFDECLAMAQDFLTTKQCGCFYRFTALDDNYDSEYCCDNELSADDVARLRALKDKYGDAFVGHLDEVFSDPDVIYDFTGGGEILAIDLANVHYRYGVSLHELHPDGTIHTISTSGCGMRNGKNRNRFPPCSGAACRCSAPGWLEAFVLSSLSASSLRVLSVVF